MKPTYVSGQLVFCSSWPWCGSIQNGDVVIVRSLTEPTDRWCKRVTGMPGDVMWNRSDEAVIVPSGHIWVEGDNKAASRDSRDLGPVPMGLIEGKVSFVMWTP